MRLEDAKNFFGTYADMNRALGIAQTTYLLWKKKGGIPFRMQLLIENKTKGKLKAKEEHDWNYAQ